MTYHSYYKTNLNPLNLQFRQKTKNFYTKSWSPAEIWTTGSTDRHDANLLKLFHATFRHFCRTCVKFQPALREDFKRSARPFQSTFDLRQKLLKKSWMLSNTYTYIRTFSSLLQTLVYLVRDVYMAVKIVTIPKPVKSIPNQKYQKFCNISNPIRNGTLLCTYVPM